MPAREGEISVRFAATYLKVREKTIRYWCVRRFGGYGPLPPQCVRRDGSGRYWILETAIKCVAATRIKTG